MVKLKDLLNEVAALHIKDTYFGTMRSKGGNGSLYKSHKRPYSYYLSVKSKKGGGHVIDLPHNINDRKKAGKWAQAYMKRRVSGMGESVK